MGNYVESNLLPGEAVAYQARVHGVIYMWPGIFTAYGVYSLSSGGSLGFAFILSGIVLAAIATMRIDTTEFAVTNRRIIAKAGILRRRSIETLLEKVESVMVDQSILGRMLDYGTVIVGGTGGMREGFKLMAHPAKLRSQINAQLEASTVSRIPR